MRQKYMPTSSSGHSRKKHSSLHGVVESALTVASPDHPREYLAALAKFLKARRQAHSKS